MAKPKTFRFESEAAMCAAYIGDAARQGWIAYPETGGFDIVLVSKKYGLQVGIEAKQRLNAEVVYQAVKHMRSSPARGPDFHAILVPEGGDGALEVMLGLVGVTVIRAFGEPDKHGMTGRSAGGGRYRTTAFNPALPADYEVKSADGYFWDSRHWFQQCPGQPVQLPDYVPDVAAGAPAPVTLTDWKVRAIKIAILLERRGVVTADDFKALKISMSRWMQNGWIKPVRRGVWEAGGMPNFRAQHPVNFDQIAADFGKWSVELPPAPADLFAGAAA